MGGFAGGDEGGYWDIETFAASIDKQNDYEWKNKNREKFDIEITDTKYSIKAHARMKSPSGWIRLEELYDTISFIPCKCEAFTIEGCDYIPLGSNTIYKAFLALNDFTDDSDIFDFFCAHKVIVIKRIALS